MDTKEKFRVDVCDGKYSVVIDDDYNLIALRYGQSWRDCIGDNLIYCLAVELKEAREKINVLMLGK